MKRSLSLAILALLLLALPAQAAGALPPEAARPVAIKINTLPAWPDPDLGSAYIDSRSDRTLVPVRFVAQSLGLEVDYRPSPHQHIVISGPQASIRLNYGDPQAHITRSGHTTSLSLDAPLRVHDGRSYLPLRFVAEVLGYDVAWDGTRVHIYGPTPDPYKGYFMPLGRFNRLAMEASFGGYDWALLPAGDSPRFNRLLNDYREDLGLAPLAHDPEAYYFALNRCLQEALQIRQEGSGDHLDPSGRPTTYYGYGENLIYAVQGAQNIPFNDPERFALDSWIKSPGHQANLASKEATRGGFAAIYFAHEDSLALVIIWNFRAG